MAVMATVQNPYKVVVIVDREYGAQLSEVADGVSVWIVDTPVNRAVAERRWANRPTESHLTSVTTFKTAGSSPDEILLQELDMFDLHHGEYSAQPPYTILEVMGAALNDKITAALGEFGFNHFQSTGTGLRATRPLPEP